MAKSNNQKLKLLFLERIFYEYTDDEHRLTMQELIAKLKDCGVRADRKTIYMDINELNNFGMDIVSERIGRSTYYHVGNRKFELPELKLLVDSVQAAKFISDEKSKTLINKLESMASIYEAKQLQRQVMLSGRVKTTNGSIYYNVDKIYTAILSDREITFRYFQWNVKKERVLRHDGALYHVSPWCLMWDDEYYYLVGYNSDDGMIKHYRVDKMLDIRVSDRVRMGQQEFEAFDMALYSKSLFGMFGGEVVNVTIEAENDMAGVLIDRFGADIFIVPKDESHFKAHVNVVPSNQFLGWIMALGEKVKITAPQFVVNKMKREISRISKQYND